MISNQCARAPRVLSAIPNRGLFGIASAKSKQFAIDEHVPAYVPHTNPSTRKKSETKISTLSNGVKVASETGSSPVLKVGVAVKAGSRFETVPGSALFMEKLGFKSTTSQSDIKLYRSLEAIGAVAKTTGDRDRLTYSLTVLPDFAAEAISILGESVCTPYLPSYEVHAIKESTVASVLDELTSSPFNFLHEAIHQAAYRDNSPLGHSYYFNDSSLIGNEVLRAFHKKQFTASNMVIAAVGIEHGRLVELSERAFSNLKQGSDSDIPSSPYKGGEVRRTGAPGTTHIAAAVGAEVKNVKDHVTLLVLRELMAKASPYDVLKYQYVDSGLVGLQGSTSADGASTLAHSLVSTLKKAGSASAEDLKAAKTKAKYAVAAWNARRDGAFDQLARTVLATGQREGLEEVLAAVDSVTASDVGKIAQSKISLATYGDLRFAPYVDEIKA